MSIAKRPSKVTLQAENKGWSNLLEFLVHKFPLIGKEIWISRLQQGKIHWLTRDHQQLQLHLGFLSFIIRYKNLYAL